MAATAKLQIGGHGFIAPKVWKAAAAPTVDNDVDNGVAVGDLWLDATALKGYVCFDNSNGAAVWKEFTFAA